MSEEKPSFSLNPQALIAMALVFLALGLPITCVLLSVMPKKEKAPVAAEEPATDALRASLERAVEKGLPGAGLESGKLSVTLQAKVPAQEAVRIQEVAKSFGATAFATQSGDGKVILLAQVEAEKLKPFLKACKEGDYSAAAPTRGASELVEIVIDRVP